MDPEELVAILTAFTATQNQLLIILELYMNDHKRIEYESSHTRHQIRQLAFFRLVHESDLCCRESTRMDRRCFTILCTLLKSIGGLSGTEVVDVEEMVALFLHVIAHDVKNRVMSRHFARSGETISRHFNSVLHAVLRLHEVLLKKPEPITSSCTDARWKWFEVPIIHLNKCLSVKSFLGIIKQMNFVLIVSTQNCLGALDGTYIKVNVSVVDRPRYRTRKGEIATNVLAACDTNGEFTFVFPGWEGSAADSRVLRDAISRPTGLKVPKGKEPHIISFITITLFG